MGFSYLDGKNWAEVTREERFFCQHLYGLLVKCGASRILSHIGDRVGTALRQDVEWEPAFEVCFYRDLGYLRGERGEYYSPKRTFDLCLFSEDMIVILEAKAQQRFEPKQMESFRGDREHVEKITGVDTALLCGLISSKYNPPHSIVETFDGPLLTWRELADIFDGDKVLERADEVYDLEELGTWGKNNDGGYFSGRQLIEAHRRGDSFCVGRKGGLHGQEFRSDLLSGDWMTRNYETTAKHSPPNSNWFPLSDFVREVERTKAATQ